MIATGQRTIFILMAAMVCVASAGFASYKSNGFSAFRSGAASNNAAQFAWNYQANTECLTKVKTKPMFCMQLGNPSRISLGILGDSTANSLVPGLADAAITRDEGIINIGQGSCPPVRGMLPTPNNPDCPAIVDDAYRVILGEKTITTVILALFTNDIGSLQFKDLPADAPIEARMKRLMSGLDADIAALTAAGKKVILTYDTPLSPIDAKDCVSRPFARWLGISKKCSVKESEVGNRHPQIDILDHHYLDRQDVCVFHQSPLLFSGDYINFKDAEGNFLIRDRHHLSEYGSKKMATLLMQSNCRY